MRLSKTNAILGVVIVLCLLAIAVLVGMRLGEQTHQDSIQANPTLEPTLPTSAADANSQDESETVDPTPRVVVSGGSELPGLLAVIQTCDKLGMASQSMSWLKPDSRTMDVRNPPTSLVIDGGDEALVSSGIAMGLVTDPTALHQCALDVLDAPPGILDRMVRTRAIDGQLADKWPGYTISWSYHPDQGLDAVIAYDLAG